MSEYQPMHRRDITLLSSNDPTSQARCDHHQHCPFCNPAWYAVTRPTHRDWTRLTWTRLTT